MFFELLGYLNDKPQAVEEIWGKMFEPKATAHIGKVNSKLTVDIKDQKSLYTDKLNHCINNEKSQ